MLFKHLHKIILSIGIGVLNYNISTKNIELSEFYSANTNLIETNGEELTAFGWLVGGKDIIVSAMQFEGLDDYYGSPDIYVWKKDSQDLVVTGMCKSLISSDYGNTSGFVTGKILGTERGICSSFLSGYITDFATLQNLPVTGIVSGGYSTSIIPVEEDVYCFGTPAGWVSQVTGFVSAELVPGGIIVSDKYHVLDIKEMNALGEKALAVKDPLLGKNLQYRPKSAIPENGFIANENWAIIEYISNYDEYINSTINSIKLKTPGYIDHIVGEDTIVYPDGRIEGILYYIISYDTNTYKIVTSINAGDSIILGPVLDKKSCINILKQYAEACGVNSLTYIGNDTFTFGVL